MGIDVDLWEIAQICGKWLQYLINGLNMWELTYIFGEIPPVFEKRLNYVGNDLDVWEMAQICGEMTLLFEKRLKNLENDLEIWEMGLKFWKWLRCMGHGLSI